MGASRFIFSGILFLALSWLYAVICLRRRAAPESGWKILYLTYALSLGCDGALFILNEIQLHRNGTIGVLLYLQID